MYAIISYKGNQYKVERDKIIRVPFLSGHEVGSRIEIDDIFMIRNDDKVSVGTPSLPGAKVTAEILAHKKDKKVIVFKKKRRKGYAKKSGHRQDFTELKIKDIASPQ